MAQLRERVRGLFKGPRNDESSLTPPDAINGNPGNDPPAERDVFERLSYEDVQTRISVASRRLKELGAFENTESVPIRHLTDEQLDARLQMVNVELARLGDEPDQHNLDSNDSIGYLSDIDRASVRRHLEVLDYLIEHPSASIPPTWVVEEEARWSECIEKDSDIHRETQTG